ncbi:MAG: hypothetical protein NTX59_02175 [Elusimicrobia bacterium]|nr:hypothetical protein [Elusimicrobiota bacterium]
MKKSAPISETISTPLLYLFCMAFLLTILWDWKQIDFGFNIADEGFLWYGTWRTILREIPVRDFQSYFPGRYYWGAFWSIFLGNGFISVRLSCIIFQFVTLTLGLFTLNRLRAPLWFLLVSGIILLTWIFPIYKSYDSGLAMAGVYFAVLIMENPSLLRHFIGGIFAGLALFFGLNHGLYAATGLFLIVVFTWAGISRHDLLKRFASYICGFFAGNLPLLAMWLTIPGFFKSCMAQITSLFQLGTTNLSLPIPWPWVVWNNLYSRTGFLNTVLFKDFIDGVILIVWLFLIVSAPVYLFIKRKHLADNPAITVLAAGVFMSIPRLHHFLSRADLEHLANSLHPVLFGLLSVPFLVNHKNKKILGATALILLLLSYPVINNSLLAERLTEKSENSAIVKLGGDNIFAPVYIANLIQMLKHCKDKYLSPGETILTIPFYPGAYPILEQKSPIYEIYPLFKAPDDRQKEIIAEIKTGNVGLIFFAYLNLDGNKDRSFPAAYHMVFEHIMNSFDNISANEGLPPGYYLFRRKNRKGSS